MKAKHPNFPPTLRIPKSARHPQIEFHVETIKPPADSRTARPICSKATPGTAR